MFRNRMCYMNPIFVAIKYENNKNYPGTNNFGSSIQRTSSRKRIHFKIPNMYKQKILHKMKELNYK